MRGWSKKRGWALDLRLALLVLFGLVWIAQRSGTSALIAGFGAGLMVAAIGGPKRLSRQVAGVATGFMVPHLLRRPRAPASTCAPSGTIPSLILLAALLLVTNAFVHVCAALLTRQSLGAGFAATAQLGVPAAVVTLGLEQHVLRAARARPSSPPRFGSLALTSAGVAMLARRTPAPGAPADQAEATAAAT